MRTVFQAIGPEYYEATLAYHCQDIGSSHTRCLGFELEPFTAESALSLAIKAV